MEELNLTCDENEVNSDLLNLCYSEPYDLSYSSVVFNCCIPERNG